MHKKLTANFYKNNSVLVAQRLLGKKLVFGDLQGYITETEAYRGADDPASHAFIGETKRTKIMFAEPGYSYVYMIYGMYFCLNIVTEKFGQAGAVLIRGLELLDGTKLDGPGKLCRHLGITKQQNGINLVNNKANFYVTQGRKVTNYQATARIGIKKAQDKLWRFVLTKENLDMILFDRGELPIERVKLKKNN